MPFWPVASLFCWAIIDMPSVEMRTAHRKDFFIVTSCDWCVRISTSRPPSIHLSRLAFVDIDVLSVHHALVLLFALAVSSARLLRCTLWLCRFIHLLGQFMRRLSQAFARSVQLRFVVGL